MAVKRCDQRRRSSFQSLWLIETSKDRMSSQGSGAIIPFLGPLWAALIKSSGSHHRPGDRALGAAATLGLSIFIMRLVAQALKKINHEGQESSALQIVQGVLRGLFAEKRSGEDTNDSKRVIHRGSCHCRAVTFEVRKKKMS
jgi:hypothetical protein